MAGAMAMAGVVALATALALAMTIEREKANGFKRHTPRA